MENIKHDKQTNADQFWKMYFDDLMDNQINEHYALEIDFWNQLKTALESVDIATIEDVMISKIALDIVSADMHLKIIKIAKNVWDDKQHRVAQNPKID